MSGVARFAASSASSLADGSALPSPFALFLAQVVVIVVCCRLLSHVFARFSHPAVVAEMCAGILLGPTVMGRIPGFSNTLFPAASLETIKTVAGFGLCFFMFLVGLELDTASVAQDLHVAGRVVAFDLGVTFGASYALALAFLTPDWSTASFGIMGLFMRCAIGMTALPVLARILSERRMLTTRVGSLALTIASIDDIIGYVLLAICLTLVRSSSALSIAWVLLLMGGECVAVYVVVRPLLRVIVERGQAFSSLSAGTFLLLSIVLLACCWFTEAIGLSALIGAFQIGLIIPRNSQLSHALTEKLEYFVVCMLMPLYFVSSGLRTQFGLINNAETVGYAVLVIFVASSSKMVATFVPCRLMGMPPRMAGVLSTLMACKGLIALIVCNYGLDYNVITPKMFAVLVLMVLVTTIITVPLVDLIDPPSRAALSALENAAFEARLVAAAAAGGGSGAAAERAPTPGDSSSCTAVAVTLSPPPVLVAEAPPPPPPPRAAATPSSPRARAPTLALLLPPPLTLSADAAPDALDGEAPGGPKPLRLMLTVSDTVNAAGLVGVANLFSNAPHAEQALHAGAHLTVTWLQGSTEMPSAYMNAVKTCEDLRDARLVAALAKSRARAESLVAAGPGLEPAAAQQPQGPLVELSVFPSRAPFADALAEAARRDSDVLLVTSRLPMLSQTVFGDLSLGGLATLIAAHAAGHGGSSAVHAATSDRVPLLKQLLAAPRTCLLAVHFNYAPAPEGQRHALLVPFDAADRAATASAVRFAALTSAADVTVHVVRVNVAASAAAGHKDNAAAAATAAAAAAAAAEGGAMPTLPAAAAAVAAAGGTSPPLAAAATGSSDAPLAGRANTQWFSVAATSVADALERILLAHAGVYRYVVLAADAASASSTAPTAQPSPLLHSLAAPPPHAAGLAPVPEDESVRGGAEFVPPPPLPTVPAQRPIDALDGQLAACAAAQTSCIVVFPRLGGAYTATRWSR